MVEDGEIVRALIAEPQQAVDTLITLVNERGRPDRISVVAVRITLPDSFAGRHATQSFVILVTFRCAAAGSLGRSRLPGGAEPTRTGAYESLRKGVSDAGVPVARCIHPGS
jgi:hypothetical protein